MYRIVMLLLAVTMFLNCAPGVRTNLVEVGTVYGFVTNSSYEPLDSVQIEIAGESEVITYTNQAGYYMLADMVPGDYSMLVTKPGYTPQTHSLTIKTNDKKELNAVLPMETSASGRISGLVVDYFSKAPLVVDVTVMDHNRTAATDSNGAFVFEDLEPMSYLLKYQAMDYVDVFSDVTVLPGRTTDIVKSMIKANTTITLYGIVFEFGKAAIKPESYPVLDSAAGILNNFPEIEVEVLGHTDSIGSTAANLVLSQKRAEAVRQYLIDVHMIEPVRLIPIGLGKTKPIADNGTEEGRAKNRRVEFLVTK